MYSPLEWLSSVFQTNVTIKRVIICLAVNWMCDLWFDSAGQQGVIILWVLLLFNLFSLYWASEAARPLLIKWKKLWKSFAFFVVKNCHASKFYMWPQIHFSLWSRSVCYATYNNVWPEMYKVHFISISSEKELHLGESNLFKHCQLTSDKNITEVNVVNLMWSTHQQQDQ